MNTPLPSTAWVFTTTPVLRDLLGILSAPPARKPRIGSSVDRKLFE
jgi:hypothetical protein